MYDISMTNERVIEALRFHDLQIEQCDPGVKAERCPTNMAPIRQVAHVRWMCKEAEGFVREGRIEKAMRWLRFIQGALWVLGISTIEDSKRANMPEGEEYKA